jgi:hypothetical protein
MSGTITGGRKTALTITVPLVELTWDKKLLRKILRQAGQEIAATARALIGRGLPRMDKNGKVLGAVAGSPPMSRSGRLARSLKVRMTGDKVIISDEAANTSETGAAFYALFLEDGSKGGGGKKGNVKGGSKTIGREHKKGGAKGVVQTKRVSFEHPFLSTALEEELPQLEKRIQEALARSIDLKTLKKAGRA